MNPEPQAIVRRMEVTFTLADLLEERLTKARTYSGRLVPQDPTE